MSKGGRRGSGEGAIHKRADGRWEARIDLGWVDGKRKRKSVYGTTHREVTEKLRRLQNDRGTTCWSSASVSASSSGSITGWR